MAGSSCGSLCNGCVCQALPDGACCKAQPTTWEQEGMRIGRLEALVCLAGWSCLLVRGTVDSLSHRIQHLLERVGRGARGACRNGRAELNTACVARGAHTMQPKDRPASREASQPASQRAKQNS